MSYQFDGRDIQTTANGYLVDPEQWSRELAAYIAGLDGLSLTEKHWDVITYLREEFFENNESTPNTRAIIKAMSDKWGDRIDQKTLYELFPLDPSKQGGRIAGVAESRRKGGY